MSIFSLPKAPLACLLPILALFWFPLVPGATDQDMHAAAMQVQVPFIENSGQVNDQVAFFAQTFAGTVYVTHQGQIVTVARHASSSEGVLHGGVAIWERMVGGNAASVRGQLETDIALNYFTSQDPDAWQTQVSSYAWVTLGEVYPGVEAKLSARGNNVEKLFLLAPGADPAAIQLHLEGIESLSVSDDGELLLHTPLGTLAYTAPVAWQTIDGDRVEVPVRYQIDSDKLSYGFTVAAYDPQHELVIDPLLAATLIGGGEIDRATDVVVENGSVYVAGHTFSQDFPTTPGVFDSALSGADGQYFVSRFDMGLTTLQASTYIGLPGAITNPFTSISMDSHNGDIYLAYNTLSNSNPVLGNSFDALYNGFGDVFIARLSADLTTLVGSTYWGGTLVDYVSALDVNPTNGQVCIVGTTESFNMPVTAGAHDLTHNGQPDAYVACLSSDLSSLVASTYLGTAGIDRGFGISVNAGSIFVGGQTSGASQFPTPNGAFQTPGGSFDGYVALFGSSLQLISATLVGGSGTDSVDHVLLHNGSVYVAGQVSDPTGFPVGGGHDSTHNGGLDGYLLRFNGLLGTFISGTFLGGSLNEHVRDIAADTDNFIYVFGITNSTDFPVSSSAFQANKFGSQNSITLSRFDATLGLLQYSSHFRGAVIPFTGLTYQIAVPTPRSVFFPGFSRLDSYITTAGAYQTTPVGQSTSGLVSHLSMESQVSEVSMGFAPISTPESVGTLSIEVTRTGSTVGYCEVYVEYADVSAMNGFDYNFGQNRVHWEPGDGSSKFVQVPITNDDFDETDETFLIGITDPAGATVAPFGGGRTITIVDDDDAGVAVFSPLPDGNLTELPDTANVGVALTSEPENGAVFITAFSDDTSAGTLSGADSNGEVQLSFGSGNWDVIQFIMVESVDDDIDDGDQPFQVDFGQILNPDPNYDGLVPSSADLTTLDDDTAGVEVQSANMPLMTSETGTSDTLSYRLASEPLGEVQINLVVDEDGMDEGILSEEELTFTSQDWDTWQPVVVTGLDDMEIDGDILYQILSEGVSSDPLYDFAMTSSGPLVINQDDDALPVDVTVTVSDSNTQMFPFIPTSYQVVVQNLSGVPIDDVQVITTTSLLDDMTMSWSCTPSGMSNCDTLTGSGNISTSVDLEPNGTVFFDVIASAVNQPFQQAILTGEAIVPFGTTDTNPGDNFAMDSNLIFVFIVFKDGFEDP